MKMFLFIIVSLLITFSYSCGSEAKETEEKKECTVNTDCADNEKCDTENSKCVIKTETGVLTSIEVDIDGVANTKEYKMLIGLEKTVIAYGIYDNDETETEDLSSKVRWYSSNRDVGITKLGSDGQTMKFISKASGQTEVYCKYLDLESDHVVFNVTEAVVEKITLSSKAGESIYLHQSTDWDIIANFEGGTQGVLNAEDLEFSSSPEGIYKDEQNKYRFPTVGTYDVTVSKDAKVSNVVSIEVKENVVTGIDLISNLEDGDFIVNTPHRVIVREILEGDGKNILEDATGITWKAETRVSNDDGTYTPTEAVEGTDYSVSGFSFTFKKTDTFYVTITKDYGGDAPFTYMKDFSVKEAK